MSRACFEKPIEAAATSGSTAKVTSASFQFSASITAAMPASSTRSLKTKETKEVNSSYMFWMSLVTRVTRRPTGLRVKNSSARS